MKWHHALWRRLTDTEALRESSGRYETEFFESTYRITYLSGFSQSDHGAGYRLYSYGVKLLIATLLLSVFWYLCTMSSSLDEVTLNISVIITVLVATYWYQVQVYKKKVYNKLATAMDSSNFDLSTPTRKDIVQIWANRSERYIKLMSGLGVATVAAAYITPLLLDGSYNLMPMCGVPYDYKTPLRYACTYTVLAVGAQCAGFFAIVHDLIMQSHLMHLLCQFQVLADCFENIIEDCSRDFAGFNDQALFHRESFQTKYNDQLRKYVKQHQFLLHQTMLFRSMMSTPMLLQFGTRAALIICQGYQVIMAVTDDFTKLMLGLPYLGYNLFVLFVYCYWCEEIKTKSVSISDAVYMSGWERGLAAAMPAVRLRLLVVAARAARPVAFTAGGLYELSLPAYTSIIKTSYSVLTFLLQVRR